MLQKLYELLQTPSLFSFSLFILNFIKQSIQRKQFIYIDDLNDFKFCHPFCLNLFSQLFGKENAVHPTITSHIDTFIYLH